MLKVVIKLLTFKVCETEFNHDKIRDTDMHLRTMTSEKKLFTTLFPLFVSIFISVTQY